jgi:predicted DCC family thiol-disulfide oxidoreductase YuxK
VGLTFDVALRRLHAQDLEGRLHKGVDAFILIWKNLPRWAYLVPLISLPIIKPLADFAYDHFADWRINRLYAQGCVIAPSTPRK